LKPLAKVDFSHNLPGAKVALLEAEGEVAMVPMISNLGESQSERPHAAKGCP